MNSPLSVKSLIENPPVGFYFLVTFLSKDGSFNPLDIRFQKVSGFSSTMETQELKQGGENLVTLKLPTHISYDNLVLERGMQVLSPLSGTFDQALSTMSFRPSNVLVMLLNAADIPVASWLFQDAYPLKWSESDLDATQSAIVIETMELTYGRMQRVNIEE